MQPMNGKPSTGSNVSQATEEKLSNRAKRKIEQEREQQRRRIFAVVGGVLAIAIVAAVVFFVTRKPSAPAVAIAPEIDTAIATDRMVMGNPDAPVTLVEWGDYSCPGCGNFALSVEPVLIDAFVKSGQVKFEFRPFPLDIHGNDAVLAAQAATCAADQGKFWRFHDTLFRNQKSEEGFSEPALTAMATQLGLDVPAFSDCLNKPETVDSVSTSVQAGKDAGVDSTPTFFINGTKVDWQGWDTLKQDIEKALK